MKRAVRAAALGCVSAALAGGLAGVADASCAAPTRPPRLVDHPIAFAGEVVATTHRGEAAEVRVVDVWTGPDLPERVVVVGGQLQPGVDSSVDRSFRTGERYGFFPRRDENGALRDNACSPTAPLSTLTDVDPPGVRPPSAAAPAPADPRSLLTPGLPAGPVALAATVLGGLAGAGWLMTRRRTVTL